MKIFKFNKLIYKIILLISIINIIYIQVYGAELELEHINYHDKNPFKFKISYTWTSKGQTIKSYDVSEHGQIAIVFSNKTIGVFDNDMNFIYQLSFDTNSTYGALWLGENLLFIDLRSNTAVICDDDGAPKSIYTITAPDNYYNDIVQERSRKQGNYYYYCTNESGNNSMAHYSYYTILKRTLKGREEILYKANILFDGVVAEKLYILSLVVIIIIWFKGIRSFRRKN